MFQLKLALDALRDLFLSPISIIAIVIDMITKREGKDSYYQQLMALGRKSDDWINLFEHQQKKPFSGGASVDSLLEQLINARNQNAKQPLSNQAKAKINDYIKKVINQEKMKGKE